MKHLNEYIKTKVNIMVGRFQPFTTGHLKCVETIQKQTGNPVIICMIETKESKLDEKHPFPSSFLLNWYKKLPIKDIVLVKNADITKIAEQLSDYQISGWVAGTDRYDSYKKMAERYGDCLSSDFQMLEIPRTDEDISASKVRELIKEDNFEKFKKFSPIKDPTYYQGLQKYILSL